MIRELDFMYDSNTEEIKLNKLGSNLHVLIFYYPQRNSLNLALAYQITAGLMSTYEQRISKTL